MTPAGLPAQALCPYGRDAWSSAFLSTPGIERLYSGVTNMTASTARSSLFSRCTSGAWLRSSSWSYSGRSPILSSLKLKSGGPELDQRVREFAIDGILAKAANDVTDLLWHS